MDGAVETHKFLLSYSHLRYVKGKVWRQGLEEQCRPLCRR